MEEKNSKEALPISKKPDVKKLKPFFSKVMPLVLGIIGVVLVILIIGLGALLAGRVWNPKWNPFRPHASTMMQTRGIPV